MKLLTSLLNNLLLRKTLASPAGVLLVPAILFVTLFAFTVLTTALLAGSDADRFQKTWEFLAAIGSTLAGVGTFFIALTLGASFLTLAAQSEQLTLQKKELEDSWRQLEAQAKTAITTARANALASRIAFYNEELEKAEAYLLSLGSYPTHAHEAAQTGWIKAENTVKELGYQRDHLYHQLNRVLDDLQVGIRHRSSGSPHDDKVAGWSK